MQNSGKTRVEEEFIVNTPVIVMLVILVIGRADGCSSTDYEYADH